MCVVCVEVCALRQACGEHRTTTDTVTRMTRRSLLPVTKSIRPNNLSGCKESIGKNTKKENPSTWEGAAKGSGIQDHLEEQGCKERWGGEFKNRQRVKWPV